MGALCGKEKSASRKNVKASDAPSNNNNNVAQQTSGGASNNNVAVAARPPVADNNTAPTKTAVAHQKESVATTSTPTTHKTQEQRDKEYADMKDEHEKEHQRTEELYKKNQQNVDRIAKERDDLHKQADKAFESGDKSLGHELREKAKAKTQELEKASKDASRSVFVQKNAKNDKYTVDLHGLHANDAIELLVEHMDGLIKQGSKGKEFTIITGAGNHSNENGPKIKPMVHKLMKEKGYTFSEVNNGSIVCTL